MAKSRKLKVTKAEKRTILRAATKRKPKADKADKADKPKSASWKAARKKRKPDPILITRKSSTKAQTRGPDLKPRKRRTSMATSKREGEDDAPVTGAKGAEYDAKAKAEADAKAYAEAEAKAKAEAKDAGVQWTPWPRYGTVPSKADAEARAKAEEDAKIRTQAAGDPWTAWPSPDPKTGEGATGATGATGPAFVTVYDASSGQTKQMAVP